MRLARISKNLEFVRFVILGICFVFCVSASVCTVAGQDKIPVVLSTDVGNEVDDQWTIVWLLLSQDRLDVLGIMSAHAPSISPPAGQVSHMILTDIVEGRMNMKSHPPLYAGADGPLADRNTPRESDAVSFLLEVSKDYDRNNRLNVLTVGAATDVASAILKDHDIVNRISVIEMGYSGWEGNEQGKEFNIQNDLTAAQIILASEVPLAVGAGQVCRENLALSLDEAEELVGHVGPIGKWLWIEFQAWYYRFIKPLREDNFSRPWIIWDNVTLAHLLGMTESEVRPRPTMNDDLSFETGGQEGEITWITDVDEEQMWSDFVQRLEHYQRTHALDQMEPKTRLYFGVP